MTSLIYSSKNAPLGVLVAVNCVKDQFPLTMNEGNSLLLKTQSGMNVTTSSGILRFFARTTNPQGALYGTSPLEQAEVDHWLELSQTRLGCATELETALTYLDQVLATSTVLVGDRITIADMAVWGALRESPQFQGILQGGTSPKNVARYYNYLCAQANFQEVHQSQPTVAPVNNQQKKKEPNADGRIAKEAGKWAELPGAKMGEVVVRFPPEASGYLHVGHAKAALLNQNYQQAFKGKLIMRFDDTNPAKENVDFEEIILEDVAMLGLKPDMFSFTSDYFDQMLNMCTGLIKRGLAYCDNTNPETMKKEREERTESQCRSNSVEQNLTMWNAMQKGTPEGLKACVRAKINMQADNGCMRDPTIYRCKPELHPRTGDKYKVYPTYDFACPIVDSMENVTHALRTSEYADRNEQYAWFVDKLKLRKVYVWEYSRLNLQHTVMSKRKLTWFVEQGLVDGWDDPRFPTVRGVMRRGMTVQGLKEFVIAQGSSKSINMMEWDKIWAFNKKVIDPVVPRYTALMKDATVPVLVKGIKTETKLVDRHPKNPDVGKKEVLYSDQVLIEGDDAKCLSEGEKVTFINCGNLLIKKINKQGADIKSIEAEPLLDDTDFKKTQKITWLAVATGFEPTPIRCLTYDHLISKAVLSKDEDFKQYINNDSKSESWLIGDPELRQLKKGQHIQLQRRGFFICDAPYEPTSPYTGRDAPLTLIFVPDGHVKEMPKFGSKHKEDGSTKSENKSSKKESAKETAQTKKGKAAEKSPAEEQPPSAPALVTAPGHKNAAQLDAEITEAGNNVRQLKASKAGKPEVDMAVKVLLALEADYKTLTGADWKPGTTTPANPPVAVAGSGPKSAEQLDAEISSAGNNVRQLKASKAGKPEIDAVVKVLLALKADYKTLTGADWKQGTTPPANPPAAVAVSGPKSAEQLDAEITSAGYNVRQLKASKASKPDIDAAVKVLLALKADYKTLTGKDWKPGTTPAANTTLAPAKTTPQAEQTKTTGASKMADSAEAQELKARLEEQGNKVRTLKSSGEDKAETDAAVAELLKLKADYKALTGEDLVAGAPRKDKKGGGGGGQKKGGAAAPAPQPTPAQKAEAPAGDGSREVKKVTRLGLEAKKEVNLAEWYSQVITKAEMIEYYDVSGCYVFRPWSFSIWEQISKWFDAKIKDYGFENCYFPLFVSANALEKEKEHIADFAPEVAWVTRCGQSELAEPIAIRPTSETVMYPAYAKWVQSHRDLPIKLNQWCSVVRWEFKHPQPFLRTREFLWQEGHSAYATYKEAEHEVHLIIDLYEEIYEQMLAIPVMKGKKTTKEKFAGADYTTTVEAYIAASGRGIQAATSHHLGQNFSKMFDISFEDPVTSERRYAYQNSWAITTRSIGVIVMVHGDNKGLVLPPRIACIQVVVVPCGITASMPDYQRQKLLDKCEELVRSLKDAEVRVRGDYRDNYSPGWKFNHWELKGVPIRVELGPKDLSNNQFVMVCRDTGAKSTHSLDGGVSAIQSELEAIHHRMFAKAKADYDNHTSLAYNFDDFCAALDKKHVILAPFCGDIPCEENIKKLSASDAVVEEGAPSMGAKALCIPFKQPKEITDADKCIGPGCTKKPEAYTLFGRSY